MTDQQESLEDALENQVSLHDAYRIMEHFVGAYLARGDTTVSDFLHAYAGSNGRAWTTDPAAIHDFAESARIVLARSNQSPDIPRARGG